MLACACAHVYACALWRDSLLVQADEGQGFVELVWKGYGPHLGEVRRAWKRGAQVGAWAPACVGVECQGCVKGCVKGWMMV